MTLKVYKRGKIWWGRWRVDGEYVYLSSKTDDERLARQFLAKEYAESFREARVGELKRRTWAEATKRYLEDHETLKSLGIYQDQSEWWTAQFAKKRVTYLDQLTPDLVRDIRRAEYARPKERGGGQRSPADVNRKIAYLRAVVNAAYREYRWFGDNAAPPLYRFIEGEVERERFLKPHEANRLIAALPEPYATMARFTLATGLRRRNVMRLKWEYIDLGTREMRIPGINMKNGSPLRIPLSDMAVEILREQVGHSSTWVFANEDGVPKREIPSKMWQRACKEAELDDLRWHDLRHTWASIAAKNGVPKEVIQQLGGWKDPRMVDRYTHQDDEALMAGAQAVSKAFSNQVIQKLDRRLGT